MAQLVAIDWHAGDRAQARAQLIDACRPPRDAADAPPPDQTPPESPSIAPRAGDPALCRHILIGHTGVVSALALTADRARLVSGSLDGSLRVWHLKNGRCERVLTMPSRVREVVVDSHDRFYAGCEDGTIVVGTLAKSEPAAVVKGHDDAVYGLALTADEKTLISGSADATLCFWDCHTMRRIHALDYRRGWVNAVVVRPDGAIIIGTEDGAISVWDGERTAWRQLDRHSLWVWGLALSSDGSTLVSGSGDSSVGIWDARDGRRIAFLEGHGDKVSKVAVTADGAWAVSGSLDQTARIWRVGTGELAASLQGHEGSVESVAISADGRIVITGSADSEVRVWSFAPEQTTTAGGATRYTNAKVLLVGDSGAGKTGLSQRLVTDTWSPSRSTVGARVDMWELPAAFDADIEGEIWLWDFGGQADQRLVHQLYMDDAALAVLVFDGQRDDLLESLAQWNRDISRGLSGDFAKLLVPRSAADGLIWTHAAVSSQVSASAWVWKRRKYWTHVRLMFERLSC